MIGINSNINSLVAQQNLNSTQSALSSAITRLSSGKRINSAADDAAGQAIASRMTSQINGLNQGVSNANDGVSMTQTASSGLSQISDNLQRIRQLAVQASSGSLSASDQASLQKEVTQRIAEVNRIASQTTYNGTNVLDGSAGTVSFQVGANVGQTIGINLSNGVSAAQLGTGVATSGSTLGTLGGLSLTSSGQTYSGTGKADITSINVLADGKGGYTFTDQNNQNLGAAAVTSLFGGAAANTGAGKVIPLKAQGAIASTTNALASAVANNVTAAGTGTTNVTTTTGFNTDTTTKLSSITLGTPLDSSSYGGSGTGDITQIDVYSDGAGGYSFKGTDGTTDSGAGNTQLAALFTVGTASGSGATAQAASLAINSSGAISGDATSNASALSTIVSGNVTTSTTAVPNVTGPSSSTLLGSVSVNLTSTGAVAGATDTTAFTSVNIYGDGSGGYTFKAVDANGQEATGAAATAAQSGVNALFTVGTSATAPAGKSLTASPALAAATNANATNAKAGLDQATALASPPKVSDIDLTATNGANLAIESIDNALNTVNSIQADLGAAQNRFSSIASTQTAQSTNLSSAQSQITDANFAQETANLSKAQVLQQAGISVLAQANSMPQQVLKLLG
ncbi:flagellin N-terminal helical domain-containing protein [Caballeronia glebae]